MNFISTLLIVLRAESNEKEYKEIDVWEYRTVVVMMVVLVVNAFLPFFLSLYLKYIRATIFLRLVMKPYTQGRNIDRVKKREKKELYSLVASISNIWYVITHK